MSSPIGPLIRKTVGKVVKYKAHEGFGFICIGDERWNDAFLSYRDYEPEKNEKKVIEAGTYVRMDLHSNATGYVAKNVYPITEQEYEAFLDRGW
jgi:cold shock CspA family protein